MFIGGLDDLDSGFGHGFTVMLVLCHCSNKALGTMLRCHILNDFLLFGCQRFPRFFIHVCEFILEVSVILNPYLGNIPERRPSIIRLTTDLAINKFGLLGDVKLTPRNRGGYESKGNNKALPGLVAWWKTHFITLLISIWVKKIKLGIGSKSTTTKSWFWSGFRHGVPFVLVAAPFGTLFGVLATETGLNLTETMVFAITVFAGAAQFTALQLMQEHAPTLVVLASGVPNPGFGQVPAEFQSFWRDSSEDLARIVHAHPTLSEAVHEAALHVDKRAIHRGN